MTCSTNLATVLALLYSCKTAGHVYIQGTGWDSPETVERDGQCNYKNTIYHVWKTVAIRKGLATGNINILSILKIGGKEDLGNYKLMNFTSVPGKNIGHTLLETVSK